MKPEAERVAKKKALEKWEEVRGFLDRVFDSSTTGAIEPCLRSHVLRYFLKRLKEAAPSERASAKTDLYEEESHLNLSDLETLIKQWDAIIKGFKETDLIEEDLDFWISCLEDEGDL